MISIYETRPHLMLQIFALERTQVITSALFCMDADLIDDKKNTAVD